MVVEVTVMSVLGVGDLVGGMVVKSDGSGGGDG